MNCSKTCPKGLNPGKAIALIKKKVRPDMNYYIHCLLIGLHHQQQVYYVVIILSPLSIHLNNRLPRRTKYQVPFVSPKIVGPSKHRKDWATIFTKHPICFCHMRIIISNVSDCFFDTPGIMRINVDTHILWDAAFRPSLFCLHLKNSILWNHFNSCPATLEDLRLMRFLQN